MHKHAGLLLGIAAITVSAAPWPRHVIDASSRGADGVRLADANGDGRPDIATGWEQGGVVRVYFHPGPDEVRDPWPAVTAGLAAAVEDAVWVDVNGDGKLEVISSAEGQARSLFVHWPPSGSASWLEPTAWKTEAIPQSQDRMMWMFATPMDLDIPGTTFLAAGGKGPGAHVGLFQIPMNSRSPSAWKWHPLRAAGWTMSLVAVDMDGDGDSDLLFTDRKESRRGCYWLENPGGGSPWSKAWTEHPIGAAGQEVMFLNLADLDRDGLTDVLAASKPRNILFLRRLTRRGTEWKSYTIQMPIEAGTAKAVAAGDIDLDGDLDLAFTTEAAEGDKRGVMWLSFRDSPFETHWSAHDISGPKGVKYDLIELIDLDADGDLDALTCEENENLGVIWYENPARGARR